MKIMFILPVLLLVGLLVWIASDGRLESLRTGSGHVRSSVANGSGGQAEGDGKTGGETGNQGTRAGKETAKTDGQGGGEPQSGIEAGDSRDYREEAGDQEAGGTSREAGGGRESGDDESGVRAGVKKKTGEAAGIAAAQEPKQAPDKAGQSQPKPEQEPKGPAVHLLFGGGVYLSGQALTAYDKAGGIGGLVDASYRAQISKADIFMVNQGFPFSERGIPAPNKPASYRVSPDRINVLKELGPVIVSIANDHVLDYGADSLVDTCKVLDNGGILRVGAGTDIGQAKRLVTVGVNGRDIGFLAASGIYPDPDWVAGDNKPGVLSGNAPAVLLEETRRAGELSDYLVVYMYWGTRKDEKPQESQRLLAKQLIDAGADLIVGCHSNSPQGIEFYKGKPIVYSLGEFLSGESIPKTELLKADVYLDDSMVRLTLLPGSSVSGLTKEMTDAAQLHDFYQLIQGISFGVTVDDHGRVRPQ